MLERWKCSFISIRFHSFLFFLFVITNRIVDIRMALVFIKNLFVFYSILLFLSLSLWLLVFFRSNFFLSHSFFSVPIMHHLFISEKKNFFPNSISNPTVHRSIWGISFFFLGCRIIDFWIFNELKAKTKTKNDLLTKSFQFQFVVVVVVAKYHHHHHHFKPK